MKKVKANEDDKLTLVQSMGPTRLTFCPGDEKPVRRSIFEKTFKIPKQPKEVK